ncbi:hypothetical protein NPIL_685911 [Nephila pilipes]|uniref:Uncharacterized protein n=1 Tax=Nephila pilipes TaxID=299642 RepID=A0A8X6N770_NEPPI|nr:hypothetical protein NPIL_685911 [Nephila pilipes]
MLSKIIWKLGITKSEAGKTRAYTAHREVKENNEYPHSRKRALPEAQETNQHTDDSRMKTSFELDHKCYLEANQTLEKPKK